MVVVVIAFATLTSSGQIVHPDELQILYGPSKLVGVTNQSHELTGYSDVGDKAEYSIYVHKPGRYRISLVTTDSKLSGFTFKASCKNQEVEKALDNQLSQEIGEIVLFDGKQTLSFEITGVDASQSPRFGNVVSYSLEFVEHVYTLSDTIATDETKMLFRNLKNIGGDGMVFGQHFAFYEGQKWKESSVSSNIQSDCNTSVGDHPALHGLDFGRSTNFALFKPYVEELYRRGGISTYSWHANNPVTGGEAYDTTGKPVSAILEMGKYWLAWKSELDKIADFLNNLSVDGIKVPVIFRPFHENTGAWFWWGKGNCSPDEFKALWQLTVDYLRNDRGVHNMLLAYSPSKISESEALAKLMYPGDRYVDIIGMDAYSDNEKFKQYLVDGAKIICEWANNTGKIPALTEVGISKGLQNSTNDDWFTDGFLDLITGDSLLRQLAYTMTWRNSSSSSYWVPLPGQPAYRGFVDFYNDPFTLFLRDLKDIYKKEIDFSVESVKKESACLRLNKTFTGWKWSSVDEGTVLSDAGYAVPDGTITIDTLNASDFITVRHPDRSGANLTIVGAKEGTRLPETAQCGSSAEEPLICFIYDAAHEVTGKLVFSGKFDGKQVDVRSNIKLASSTGWDTLVVRLSDNSMFDRNASAISLSTLRFENLVSDNTSIELKIKEIFVGSEKLMPEIETQGNPTSTISVGSNTSKFEVYPNPATESVTIRLTDSCFNSIVLSNCMGRLVKTVDVSCRNDAVILYVGDLPKGIYYILLRGEKGVHTQPVIIS